MRVCVRVRVRVRACARTRIRVWTKRGKCIRRDERRLKACVGPGVGGNYTRKVFARGLGPSQHQPLLLPTASILCACVLAVRLCVGRFVVAISSEAHRGPSIRPNDYPSANSRHDYTRTTIFISRMYTLFREIVSAYMTYMFYIVFLSSRDRIQIMTTARSVPGGRILQRARVPFFVEAKHNILYLSATLWVRD